MASTRTPAAARGRDRGRSPSVCSAPSRESAVIREMLRVIIAIVIMNNSYDYSKWLL